MDNGGTRLHLTGGLEESRMVMTGERIARGKPVTDRISWTPNPDGTVRQLWELSADGGETWQVAVRRPLPSGRAGGGGGDRVSHVRTIRVRGYHCDFYGHVNKARYLELLEEARWSLLEDRLDLADWERQATWASSSRRHIRYLRPAVPDDLLEIHSAMVELGTKTGVIHQRGRQPGHRQG